MAAFSTQIFTELGVQPKSLNHLHIKMTIKNKTNGQARGYQASSPPEGDSAQQQQGACPKEQPATSQ